jgi:hypothetical protein
VPVPEFVAGVQSFPDGEDAVDVARWLFLSARFTVVEKSAQINDLRVVEEEDGIECGEFVQRHVARLVPFSGASHDVDVVVEAFEGVLFVERQLFFRLVRDKGAVGHLGVAHLRSVEESVYLSSQWHCRPVGLAGGVGQCVVDVLVVHCAGWRDAPDRVEGHGWCLKLESFGEWFLGPLHISTHHVPEHILPRKA